MGGKIASRDLNFYFNLWHKIPPVKIRTSVPISSFVAVQMRICVFRCQCNSHADTCNEHDGTGCPCQNNTETSSCLSSSQNDRKECYRQQVIVTYIHFTELILCSKSIQQYKPALLATYVITV